MSDNVTKSELITGMLKSADIASNILNAINFGEDMKRSDIVMKDINTRFTWTLSSVQDLIKLAMKDGYNVLKEAVGILPQDSKILMKYIQDQLMQSSAGYHMTASLLGQEAKIYAQENYSDLYATLLFEMPKGYVSEKVKRYYNKIILPYRFSPEMATHLWNKSKIKEAYWRDIMAENGIPKMEQDLILDEIEQKPNVGTLLRMYQYIDIPDSAINYILNENDITDPMVKSLWIQYFHAQRLRDEMMEYKLYLKQAFQGGLINSAQLETELKTFKASQEEIDQIVETQEAQFQRTLLTTEQETRTWLYRKGLYGDPETGEGAEEEFYSALAALNIDLSLVNAIVRLEAAKKSIDWEQQ
jgi:hypothetical protein